MAEAELERDVRATMRRLAYSGSGNVPGRENIAMVRRGGGGIRPAAAERIEKISGNFC